MELLFAGLAILVVLLLMIVLHWSGQKAGPAGWLVGLVVAIAVFGLTPQVFLVSQAKGLLLAFFVLAILFPALLLFNLVDHAHGIRAIADALSDIVGDRGLLLVTLAWCFSSLLQGLAGFGLPIAIVAPMLVALDVNPVTAVAAVAVGHAWAVTFGDMGVIFQTLSAVVGIDALVLAPFSALLLGIACVVCGLACASILGARQRTRLIVVIGVLMGSVQYLFAIIGLAPLSAFAAGLAGAVAAVLFGRRQDVSLTRLFRFPPLRAATLSYSGLSSLMVIVTLVDPINRALNQVSWQASFPAVTTVGGFSTPASTGQAFRFLTHPGTLMLLVGGISFFAFVRYRLCDAGCWKDILRATVKSGLPAGIGIISMVCLAALMDHTGMTVVLAKAMVGLAGSLYPLASPFVGILGAFATGSNNSSNVLFGPLQKEAALLLRIDPRVLIAAQTTGGALGSMVAPAKIIVGCSTVGLIGQDGAVLKKTLVPALVIGAATGLAALLLALR